MIKLFFSKIWNLIRAIKNPPLFFYWFHHYIKKHVSTNLAYKIAKKNKSDYDRLGIRLIQLDTYDKSGQCCHPDIIIFDKKYWLVCTPYPYGMEDYENPCVFSGESLTSLKHVGTSPIAYPSGVSYGNHLSDPCLFIVNNSLFCLYRDTINKNGVVINKLLAKQYLSNNQWGDSFTVYQSDIDGLLSPAIFQLKNNIYLFYVSYIKKQLILRCLVMDDSFNVITQETCHLGNCPSNMDIWHIAITKNQDDSLKGLFLLRDRTNKNSMELVCTRCSYEFTKWEIQKPVIIPNNIKEIVNFPYKSCFIPNTDKILLSYKDNNSRYCLSIV